MRSMSVAFFIIIFTFVVVVVSSMGVFPWMTATAYGQVPDQNYVANMTMSSTQLNAQTSVTQTDIVSSLFQSVGFNILNSIGTILRSVLYCQDLLSYVGFPSVVGWSLQSIIWTTYTLDMLTLWRGIQW